MTISLPQHHEPSNMSPSPSLASGIVTRFVRWITRETRSPIECRIDSLLKESHGPTLAGYQELEKLAGDGHLGAYPKALRTLMGRSWAPPRCFADVWNPHPMKSAKVLRACPSLPPAFVYSYALHLAAESRSDGMRQWLAESHGNPGVWAAMLTHKRTEPIVETIQQIPAAVQDPRVKELLDLRPPLDGLGTACSRKEATGIADAWCADNGNPGLIKLEAWVVEENVLRPPADIDENMLDRCWVAHLARWGATSGFDERLDWYVATMSGRGRPKGPFLLIAKEGGKPLGQWES